MTPKPHPAGAALGLRGGALALGLGLQTSVDRTAQHPNDLTIQAALFPVGPLLQVKVEIRGQPQKDPYKPGHGFSIHQLDTTPLSCYYQYITRVSE